MTNEQTKIWNATLYLRLSREDGDKEESNSITGQRELLRDFIAKHPDIQEYTVRADDGWSGSTFERPDFQRMMEDVKAGRTDCIIVKDLSRFGRNYLEAGEYIEKIFPFLGVRFIAVNDNYDSSAPKKANDDLIIPFKNLINEAYCRDISVKIRTQLDIKRKSGQFLGAFATYGYMKDPDNKNKLIVDEYAADIVRDIFKWKLKGVSPRDIADALNKLGILSPAEYKKSLGLNYITPFKQSEKAMWSVSAVLRILKNPVYTGVLIQGKETTPSHKVHKRIRNTPADWVIIENNHESIIAKMVFDTTQKVLSLDTRKGKEEDVVSLFSGMVFCGECGAGMVRKTVPAGGKKYNYYICSAHKQYKSCTPHRIRDTELEAIVLQTLQTYIRQVLELDELLRMTDTAPLRTAEAQKLQRQLDMKKTELERANKLLMSLYENYTEGIITREEYSRMKQTYSDRTEELERQLHVLQDSLVSIREKCSYENEWIAEFRKHENITALERNIVVSLIDRILVYADRHVDIAFRWKDEFAWYTELLHRSAEKEAV